VTGAPYWRTEFAGRPRSEIEHADGSTTPLWAGDSRQLRPGDASLIERCGGPTLDVGSGPGRLTMALAERGVPALGIDVTPQAVHLARSAGALTLERDVFSRVPGTGRWIIVLLADGSIGIGGDPVALLSRVAELLAPRGQALVELEPPGRELRRECVRFWHGKQAGDWFPWAHVGVDQLAGIATEAGLSRGDTWSCDGRWFVTLRKRCHSLPLALEPLSCAVGGRIRPEPHTVMTMRRRAAGLTSGRGSRRGSTCRRVPRSEPAQDR
jgi:SAM-dependent methyltransferase